ncbi:hypothetical protein DDZ18_10280 [Marinicauda salina]|uniref:Uncharacterized protein n=1 Tax=Marinicauda salina TaxID=2135793 RepID=A0A2U2BSU4_9PROT|nr:hypothetical protein [Marinicauda salina]PWE17079.1 hypothetical protein DDZ18_10280 [Marinicauda salina]
MESLISLVLSAVVWIQLAAAGALSVMLADIRGAEFHATDLTPLGLLAGAAGCALLARRLRRRG